MTRILIAVFAALLFMPISGGGVAEAGWTKSKGKYSGGRSVRRGPQVKGYRARRGGYSSSANDVANTEGSSRSRYGSVNSYRDPYSDRQTLAGPFDHGWFFDSAIAPRGGDSPYMQ